MGRREFITLVGSAAVTWPMAARAQQPNLPVIGFLNPRSKPRGEAVAAAFRQGLQDAGYEEGRNVVVEYRWADDQNDRLPLLAAELVARNVSAIVVAGSAWRAAKEATTTIPIVLQRG